MKLKNFIKKLNKIKLEFGGNVEVIMADNIPVVDPVYISGCNEKKVVITDQK